MRRALLAGSAPWLVLFATAAGCGGDTTSGARLGDGCTQDSDCRQGMKCGFGRCHQGCTTSADCEQQARCVLSKAGGGVCQLPDNERCTVDADCLSPLACGSDGTCRNECDGTADCAKGQSCSDEGLCAEPEELEGGTIVGPSSGQGGTGEDRGTGGRGPGTGGAKAAGGQGVSSGASATGGAPKTNDAGVDSDAGATGGKSSDGQDSGGAHNGAAGHVGIDSGTNPTGGKSSHGGENSGGIDNGAAGSSDSGKETGGTATGGASSGTGGAGAGGDPPLTGISVSNGYATGYGFQGYWSTYAETVAINPECPSPCFENSGGSVCVQGTVPPPPEGTAYYSVQSAVTWNLNQSMEESPEFVSISGLTVDLSSYSILNIGIEQRSGEGTRFFAGVFSVAKNATLCGPVVPGMNELRFQDLESLCVLSASLRKPLTEEDLQSAVAVVVIALSEQAGSFDFCITHVSFE